jgi:hypothetical protein
LNTTYALKLPSEISEIEVLFFRNGFSLQFFYQFFLSHVLESPNKNKIQTELSMKTGFVWE